MRWRYPLQLLEHLQRLGLWKGMLLTGELQTSSPLPASLPPPHPRLPLQAAPSVWQPQWQHSHEGASVLGASMPKILWCCMQTVAVATFGPSSPFASPVTLTLGLQLLQQHAKTLLLVEVGQRWRALGGSPCCRKP